jgi:hypothetical protein
MVVSIGRNTWWPVSAGSNCPSIHERSSIHSHSLGREQPTYEDASWSFNSRRSTLP